MGIIKFVKFGRNLFVINLVFLCSCASFQTKMMLNSTRPLRKNIKLAINQSTDLDMVRDAMPAALVQMDGFIKMAPDNKELLVNAAQAYSGYAFAFVEDVNKERAKKIYKKAKDYAFRALMENDDFKEAHDKSLEEFKKSMASFEKEDVPALFFAANTWLKCISLNLDNPEVLMDLPKVEAMMFRIEELDQNFLYGSIHAMLGAYYAARSVTLGGKPQKAEFHFKRAFEISKSKYLIFKLLYARFYAVQIQDRDLFVKTLTYIINAPENLLPGQNLTNEIARSKARRLLADVDEYF